MKNSLRKNLGKTFSIHSEQESFLVEVEAMIDSRPLTFVYSEVEKTSPLILAHLLIGKILLELPALRQNDLISITKENLVKRYRLRETLLNHFGKRWRK